MSANRNDLVERVRQRLVATANAAGWGYYAGKSSRIEPTCWALLALARANRRSADAWTAFAQPHLAFLERLQDASGLLVETEPALANLTANALAAITVAQLGADSGARTLPRLEAALADVKGVKLQQIDPRQDSSLQGWPWVRDTFSWVEPTAWCLLALKRTGRSGALASAVAAREQEAERLLANRMCTGGGWNFGNATALGQDLRAYVPTTAVALLALQDRADRPEVRQSLNWLSAERLSESGTLSLSLVSICLRLYRSPTDDVDERLEESVARSEEMGNVQAMAMALYALSEDGVGGDALHVA
jgi:hypothetical protein